MRVPVASGARVIAEGLFLITEWGPRERFPQESSSQAFETRGLVQLNCLCGIVRQSLVGFRTPGRLGVEVPVLQLSPRWWLFLLRAVSGPWLQAGNSVRGGGRTVSKCCPPSWGRWRSECRTPAQACNSGSEMLMLSDGVCLLWWPCGRRRGGTLLRLGLQWWPHDAEMTRVSWGTLGDVRSGRSQPTWWISPGHGEGDAVASELSLTLPATWSLSYLSPQG